MAHLRLTLSPALHNGISFPFMRPTRFAAGLVFAFFAVQFALPASAQQPQVDRIFAPYDKPASPGCALGVIQDGNFVYRRGYGMASLELGVPLSADSVFYMGSVSKQFTAASIVLASERGFLSLDDNVRKYIPELPDYGRPITLREMLHHTSGLRDFETLLDISGGHASDLHTPAEMLDLIARQKHLNNLPGDEYIYSNTNFFLLGVVLERATGNSLAEFAAENIFKPLGMVHSRFDDDHTQVIPGRIPAYAPGSNGRFLVNWSTNFDLVGAGGLMSSVDDLLYWDRNFYRNRLGNGTLLREMQTRGVLTNGRRIAYALGLEIGEYRGLPIVEHNGALFGYRTEILRFPNQRFSVLCLCNRSDASPTILARNVADVYLQSALQPEPAALESSGGKLPEPSQFAGQYLDPRTHQVDTFTASGGNLIGWGSKLRRIGPNQFNDLDAGAITFSNSAGGMKATIVTDGTVFFAGRRIHPPHLSAAALKDYAGRYFSSELQATYRIAPANGGLKLRIGWNPPLTLTPLTHDEFEAAFGTLVFRRAAGDRISGLSVFNENARNVAFEKTR
jgi:CubicO group peptidase (beta-lactamase class C family)